jgi:hypothetical protein
MKTILCTLALGSLLLAAPGQDARKHFRALTDEYVTELQTYQEELARRAEAGEDTAEYALQWHPAHGSAKVFAEAAGEYAGTDDAVQFLWWVVQNAPGEGEALPEPASKALDRLIVDHAGSSELYSNLRYAAYASFSIGEPRVLAFTGAVLERTEDPDLVFGAALGRAMTRMIDSRTTDEERALCRQELELAREVGGEERLAEVESFFFELENLQIGQLAPDIEGVDLDGVAFKLSDYRGKVVMLDFWGDW